MHRSRVHASTPIGARRWAGWGPGPLRRVLVGLPLCLLVLLAPAGPLTARAETFSVSADLPVSLTFANGAATDRVNGTVVDVALPILLGAGITRIRGWSGVNTVDYTALHILFDLPVFFIKVRGGLGIGQARPFFPTSVSRYKNAPIDELYVRGGLELFPGLEAHLGFHSLQGDAEITGPVPGKLDLSATVYTVGLTMGF